LSSGFINQIDFCSTSENGKKLENFQPVKNRYIHHLNKIVNGQVRFI